MIGAHAVNVHVSDTIDPRVLPTLMLKAQALENYADTIGVLFGYPDYAGYRSQADTALLIRWRDEAVQAGGPSAYYPVSPFNVGYHGKGSAFDIKVVRWPAGRSSSWAYQALGAYCTRIGLRWGGTFSAPHTDPYHFELAISLADAQALFDAFQAQQRALALSGKPAVTVTKAAPSDISKNLTFTNFSLPTAELPKSLSEIQSILTGGGTVGVVLIVGGALVLAGLLFGPRGG